MIFLLQRTLRIHIRPFYSFSCWTGIKDNETGHIGLITTCSAVIMGIVIAKLSDHIKKHLKVNIR